MGHVSFDKPLTGYEALSKSAPANRLIFGAAKAVAMAYAEAAYSGPGCHYPGLPNAPVDCLGGGRFAFASLFAAYNYSFSKSTSKDDLAWDPMLPSILFYIGLAETKSDVTGEPDFHAELGAKYTW